MVMQEQNRRQLLAEFLRSRRTRLAPDTYGLPVQNRRRTPGLRREEVAQLAGVGLTWYTWLEQGRDISVSDQVLEAIASALQLDPYETQHLFTLAGRELVYGELLDEQTSISPSLRSLLQHQGMFPAFILGRRWDILAWNPTANLLLGPLEALPIEVRNHLWLMFMKPDIRACLLDWENHAQRMIAEFRVSYGRYLEDKRFTALIEALLDASPEFSAWWGQHEVRGRLNVYKEFEHPEFGRLSFEQTTLLMSENPDLKLIIKMPLVGTDTLQKLHTMLTRAAG